jgi:hypothetical protein
VSASFKINHKDPNVKTHLLPHFPSQFCHFKSCCYPACHLITALALSGETAGLFPYVASYSKTILKRRAPNVMEGTYGLELRRRWYVAITEVTRISSMGAGNVQVY